MDTPEENLENSTVAADVNDERDAYVQALSYLANNLGARMGVTLHLGGLVVTGTTTSRADYDQRLKADMMTPPPPC